MKVFGSYISRALACVAVAVGLCVSAQADEGKAVVRAVRGAAQYKSAAAGTWAPLKVGNTLRSGAIIQTAAGSQVDLFLGANGPVVRVTESTEMALDKLAFQKTGDDTVIETQLDLKAGTLLGNVKKLAAASRYDIKTPNGVAGIRGTQYKVSANGVITCIEGTVHISYINPFNGQRVELDLPQGKTFIPPTATQPQQIVDYTGGPINWGPPETGPRTVVTETGIEIFVSPINGQGETTTTQPPPPPPNNDSP